MKQYFLLAFLFVSTSSSAALISVDISLNTSFFNPGPFTHSSPMSISFDIDTSVSPTATGSTSPYYTWAGALDNFLVTVDDPTLGQLTFSGTDGRYRQQSQGYLSGSISPATGIGSFIDNPFENDTKLGTSSTAYDPFNLISMGFDFRLNNSAMANFTTNQVITNLTEADFNYLSLNLKFSHDTAGLLTKWNINNGSYFQTVNFSGSSLQSTNIPEPAPIFLLSLGLFMLRVFATKNTAAKSGVL